MEYVALFMILLGVGQCIRSAGKSEAGKAGGSLLFKWLNKRI